MKSAEIRTPLPKGSGYIDEVSPIKRTTSKDSNKKNSGYTDTGFDSEEERKKQQTAQPKSHPMVRRVSKVRPIQGSYIEGNNDDF